MVRQRPVRGRHAAALIRLVDDVVVDEGAGLVELESRAEVGERDRFECCAGADRVADVCHECAEALSS